MSSTRRPVIRAKNVAFHVLTRTERRMSKATRRGTVTAGDVAALARARSEYDQALRAWRRG